MSSPKLGFALAEALRSLRRNPFMSFLAASAIAVALSLAGGWMLLEANARAMMSTLEERFEVVAYLQEGMEPARVTACAQTLGSLPGVAGHELVDSEAAAKAMAEDPELKRWLDVLGRNPLPASVRLRVAARDPESMRRLADAAKAVDGVADVAWGRDAVERLLKGFSVVRWLLSAVSLLMGLAALLVVANVLKLTAHARREEIDIMRLVGAPEWLVRLPFLMEGVIHGAVGGLVAAGGLLAVGRLVERQAQVQLQVDLAAFFPCGVDLPFAAQLVGIGAAMGLLASLFAAQRNAR